MVRGESGKGDKIRPFDRKKWDDAWEPLEKKKKKKKGKIKWK